MTTSRARARSLQIPWQATTAAASALALVLVIILSPSTVEAAGVLSTLRSPGDAGFVVGHRGGKVAAPENTLPALAAAIAGPAEFVEVDVQLTSDGVPVLMHDWTVDRTTDGSGPVWAMTYEQVRELDAGSWFSAAFEGTRVPSFEEFLGLLQPSATQAIVEIKGAWNRAQSAALAEMVREHGLGSRVMFASFSLTTLQHLHAAAPDIPRAIIVREVHGDPAVLAAACGAVAIVANGRIALRQRDVVERIHAGGLGALLYTLNDEVSWHDAVRLGADGIITDRPGELKVWLDEVHSAP